MFDAARTKAIRAQLPPLFAITTLPENFAEEQIVLYEAIRAGETGYISATLQQSPVPRQLVRGSSNMSAVAHLLDVFYIPDQVVAKVAPVLFPYVDGLERAPKGTLLQTAKKEKRGLEIQTMIQEFMEWEITERHEPLEIAPDGDLIRKSIVSAGKLNMLEPGKGLLGANGLPMHRP